MRGLYALDYEGCCILVEQLEWLIARASPQFRVEYEKDLKEVKNRMVGLVRVDGRTKEARQRTT